MPRQRPTCNKYCFLSNYNKDILVKRGILPLEVVNTPAIAGRLALYLKNWQAVTQDLWVLNTVQGYRIEFLSEPTQRSCPKEVT